MALFESALKCELIELADELGVELDPKWKKVQIQKAITGMEGYSENLIEKSLEALKKLAEKKDAREREEREREDAREREEREREKDREQELKKLKILGDKPPAPQIPDPSRGRHLPDIRKLVPVFNAQDTDINLFLSILERQLRATQVEEELWTTQLLAVLPIEVAQIVLQEGEENIPTYATAKRVLLDRFRLTPEAFRQKFVSHARRGTGRWRDFGFELQEYLNGWLAGLKIETFDQLKDLMIADQMKKKAGTEAKTQFIDTWGEMVSPWEVAEKLDRFELVRPNLRKQTLPTPKDNWRFGRGSEQNSKKGEFKRPDKNQERTFGKNRESNSTEGKNFGKKNESESEKKTETFMLFVRF